jgi:acyl-CoA reductase-like NAD-dependent aldehyde dehydrogenase
MPRACRPTRCSCCTAPARPWALRWWRHPGVAGVVFTGSTQVAKIINRALAAKDGAIVPLIAETGGINAMLVDSTALPEQVVTRWCKARFRSRRPALLGAAPAVRA